jgi:Flp pilus assembly protein TadD
VKNSNRTLSAPGGPQRIILLALLGAFVAMFIGSFAYRMQSKGLTVEVRQEQAGGRGGMGSGGPMGMMGVDMDALRGLMRQVEQTPDDPKVLLDLGNTFMMMQAWDKALEYLAHAEKVAPQDMRVQRALGMARFERKEYDQAKKAFDKVLAKEPGDALTHYNMGILLKHYMKKTAEGDAHFRKVVQLAPEDKEVLKSAQEELVPAKGQ